MDMSICDSVAASSMSEREASPHTADPEETREHWDQEQESTTRGSEDDEKVTELMIDRAHKTYVGIKFEVAHTDGRRDIAPYKSMPALAEIAKRAHASVTINEGQLTGQADPRELLKGKLQRTETTAPHTAQYVMTSNAMIELRISPRNKEAKRNGGNEITRLIHATAGALIENQPKQNTYSVERDGTRELLQSARRQQGTGTTTGGFRNPYGNQQPGMSADDADEMTRCDLMIIVDRYTQHLEQGDTVLESISGVRHVTKELLETTNSRASISRILGVSIDTVRRAASADPNKCRHTTYMRLLQTINEVCNPPLDLCTEDDDDQWATPDSAWEDDEYTDGGQRTYPVQHPPRTETQQDEIGTWSVDEFTRSPFEPTINEDVANITQEHLHGTGIGGFRNPYGNGQGKGYKGRGKADREQNKTPEDKRLEDISWAICKVLRHSAIDWGIQMDSAGYVLVRDLTTPPEFDRPRKREASDDIRAMRELAPTTEDIERLVRTARKERFQLKTSNQGERMIRALQGHTLRFIEDHRLAEIILYGEIPYCMHRTTMEAWWFIQKGGIETRGRNHIHLIREGEARTEVPGARATSDIQIKSDARKAQADGMEFRRAENGVILTRGVEGKIGLKYILEATKHVGNFLGEGSVIWVQHNADEPETHTRPPADEDGLTHRQRMARMRSKVRIEQYGEKKRVAREQEQAPRAREITAEVTQEKDTATQNTERSSSSWEKRNYQSGGLQQWTASDSWSRKNERDNRRWKTKSQGTTQTWNGYHDQWEKPQERSEYCYEIGEEQDKEDSAEHKGDTISAGVAVARYDEKTEQPQILLIGRGGKWGRQPQPPKGRQERGEELIKTAYRELKEEAGLILTPHEERTTKIGTTRYRFQGAYKTVHFYMHDMTGIDEDRHRWVRAEKGTQSVDWWTESGVFEYGDHKFGKDNARIMKTALSGARNKMKDKRCQEVEIIERTEQLEEQGRQIGMQTIQNILADANAPQQPTEQARQRTDTTRPLRMLNRRLPRHNGGTEEGNTRDTKNNKQHPQEMGTTDGDQGHAHGDSRHTLGERGNDDDKQSNSNAASLVHAREIAAVDTPRMEAEGPMTNGEESPTCSRQSN